MSCCGQSRRMWQSAPKRMAAPNPPSPPVLQNPVALEHHGDTEIVVNGPQTGLTYVFPARGRAINADARDVAGLVASGYFKLA
jgi:hypothetical protein